MPAKTKSFTVTLASPGPGETARVAVFDPSGREAASGQTGDAREVILKITVPPGQDAKAWSVAPSKATKGVLEDYTIALGDNLPAYWAHAPDRLLVPTR